MFCEMEWLNTEAGQFKIRNQVHVFDSETIRPPEQHIRSYSEFSITWHFYIKSVRLSKGLVLVPLVLPRRVGLDDPQRSLPTPTIL